MYDIQFVEAICRGFELERKNPARANQLLDLLQAVVLEDISEIQQQLTAIIKTDSSTALRREN
jgi:hypothetical protein